MQQQHTSRAKVPTPKQFSSVGVKKDEFETFWHVLITYCSQDYEYMDFFEGGQFSRWTALSADPTRGVLVTANEANDDDAVANARRQTLLKRASLNSLLTTIAAYCPDGLFKSIITDSTSIAWIKQRLIKVCNIETNGRHLPKVLNIKYNRGEESPAAFMERIKSTFLDSLMPAGTNFHGTPIIAQETFTPTFESMIIIMCLRAIHQDLPEFIMENKGNLFTNNTPNFCDIQGELCEIMDTMLSQLENRESLSRIQLQGTGQNESLRWVKNSKSQSYKNNPVNLKPLMQSSSSKNQLLCEYCKALGKDVKIWSSHNKLDCFALFPEKRNKYGRARILSVPVYTDDDDKFNLQDALRSVEDQYNATQDTENNSESDSLIPQ